MSPKKLGSSADRLNMMFSGSEPLIPDPLRDEWSNHTRGTYESFLDWLAGNSVTQNNCFRVPYSNGDRSLLSSPFISALVGLLLLALPHTRKGNQVIRSIRSHLIGHLNNKGLIGFLEPNFHRYELDTLVTCYSFLLLTARNELSSRLPCIESLLHQNRCPGSGAYYTWIEKPNNQIDYVVNMNIRFFRSVQGVADDGLDKFLVANLTTFLSRGSHYYSDTLFPRLLASAYYDTCPFTSHDHVFKSVLEKLRLPQDQVQDLLIEYNHPLNKPLWRSFQIPTYFNSQDATFQSPLLDKLLGMYMTLKRSKLEIRNLNQRRLESSKL